MLPDLAAIVKLSRRIDLIMNGYALKSVRSIVLKNTFIFSLNKVILILHISYRWRRTTNLNRRTGAMMKTVKQWLFALLMMFFCISAAAAAEEKVGPPAAPGPVVIHMANFPITMGKSEYGLLTIVQDFPAGAGVANHKHGGHVLVTVLSGEMTMREKGGERIIKTGESWTERPGAVHSVVNAGTDTARVVVSLLLPKGAKITTMVK